MIWNKQQTAKLITIAIGMVYGMVYIVRRKEMEKQTYEELKMETIIFETEDVIITSEGGDCDEGEG